LNRRDSFFETQKYFGPDRHIGLHVHHQRDQGKSLQYRKLLIVRNLESGITILKDKVCTAPPANNAKSNIAIAV
ncbi:MAG: hypothetical protein L3J13_06225, partial [Devosiaceae bacterium]|nr:hypothetical protein [Devosiaceae bacterium]